MIRYFIGTSGWHYNDWRGLFYPDKLPRAQWLGFFAGRFPTLELNNSFYRLPTERAFINWYNSTPPDFIFAVKVSRFITHVKRLKDCDEAIDNFMSRTRLLKEKLGPLLYQLPPGLRRNDDLLEAFLQKLPEGIKHVIEFRHASWLSEEVYSLLRRYNIGFCVFDMPELTSPLIATADFAYIRFHGRDSLYSSCYPDEELAGWARKIASLAEKLESVYVYFNNDIQGFALKNAVTLRELLEKGKTL